MSPPYKVDLTIRGLPQGEAEYEEALNKALDALRDAGFDNVDIGVGEEE